MTKAEQLADNPSFSTFWIRDAAAELRRLAPMEARVKELEDAFSQVRHSITQAKLVGNDWRRELDLINNITNAVLGETK